MSVRSITSPPTLVHHLYPRYDVIRVKGDLSFIHCGADRDEESNCTACVCVCVCLCVRTSLVVIQSPGSNVLSAGLHSVFFILLLRTKLLDASLLSVISTKTLLNFRQSLNKNNIHPSERFSSNLRPYKTALKSLSHDHSDTLNMCDPM